MDVSIIIPLFNKEDFVVETLKSIEDQTFMDWECIIVDDGSTDNSLGKVKDYIQDKERFRLYNRPHIRMKGASTCRNVGLEMAKGKYIQFLDADDLVSSEKLKRQVDLLNYKDGFTISTCRWGRLSSGETIIYENLSSYINCNSVPDFLSSLIKDHGYFPLHAYLIPKILIDRAGQWNEHLGLNDDGEFMARVLCYTQRIIFSSHSLALYRTHSGNNLSSSSDLNSLKKAMYSWQLIDNQLAIAFGQRQHFYIEWNLKSFYREVKQNNPEYLKDLEPFFENVIVKSSKFSTVKRRLRKRLKSFLSFAR